MNDITSMYISFFLINAMFFGLGLFFGWILWKVKPKASKKEK